MKADLIELFTTVRDLPYATNAAHSGSELLTQGRGSCAAKAGYLVDRFREYGVPARRTRWFYRLWDQPAEVRQLLSPYDIHTAVQVHLGGRWLTIDATHDPALATAGLPVAEWDARGDTVLAYEPLGAPWTPSGGRPEPVVNGGRRDPAGPLYRGAFNRWLDDVRRHPLPVTPPVRRRAAPGPSPAATPGHRDD